jgi:hypothetical protein
MLLLMHPFQDATLSFFGVHQTQCSIG